MMVSEPEKVYNYNASNKIIIGSCRFEVYLGLQKHYWAQ